MVVIEKSSAFTQGWFMEGFFYALFKNGSMWAFPCKSWEYAMMNRRGFSAGVYFNRVIKPRGGYELQPVPLKVKHPKVVDIQVARLSLKFNKATGLA